MKKVIFCLLAMVLAFASCEGPAGPMGPEGPGGTGSNWKIYNITVNSRDWELLEDADGTHPRYVSTYDLEGLTDEEFNFIYTDGVVHAYLYTDMGVETQTPLPYTLSREDYDKQGNQILWQENYTFDYAPGSIAFYATYSDFFVEQRPGSMEFKVVMMW